MHINLSVILTKRFITSFILLFLNFISGISYCNAQSNDANPKIIDRIFNTQNDSKSSEPSISKTISKSIVYTDVDNNKLEKWLTVYKEVYKNDKYYSDSMLLINLNNILNEREKEISEILKIRGINTSKDPFETTAAYQMRISKINEYRDSLQRQYIKPISNQINSLKGNIYQDKVNSNINLLLDLSNFNADKSLWITNMLYKNKMYLVELHINPLSAKTLWENKNNILIYDLKKLNGKFNDFIEIVFGSPEKNILIKKIDENNVDENLDDIYTTVEIEAEFPGGSSAWFRYLQREIERNIDELQDDGKSGNATILFIVDKEGNVSGVQALSCSETGIENCLEPESKLAQLAVNAIKKGPKWKPAIQNGRQVKAYHRQTVGFNMSN